MAYCIWEVETFGHAFYTPPRKLLQIQRRYRRTMDAQRVTAKDKKAGPFKDSKGNLKFFSREFMQRTSLRRPSRGVVT